MANPNSDEAFLQQWSDMTPAQIHEFMTDYPTYCMEPKEASDWWAGVERGIRIDQERRLTGHAHGAGRTYKLVCIGGTKNGEPIYEQVEI